MLAYEKAYITNKYLKNVNAHGEDNEKLVSPPWRVEEFLIATTSSKPPSQGFDFLDVIHEVDVENTIATIIATDEMKDVLMTWSLHELWW